MLHFHGAADIVVVGDGHADAQRARPRRNCPDGIAAVRVVRMKMHVEDREIPAQTRQVRNVELYSGRQGIGHRSLFLSLRRSVKRLKI